MNTNSHSAEVIADPNVNLNEPQSLDVDPQDGCEQTEHSENDNVNDHEIVNKHENGDEHEDANVYENDNGNDIDDGAEKESDSEPEYDQSATVAAPNELHPNQHQVAQPEPVHQQHHHDHAAPASAPAPVSVSVPAQTLVNTPSSTRGLTDDPMSIDTYPHEQKQNEDPEPPHLPSSPVPPPPPPLPPLPSQQKQSVQQQQESVIVSATVDIEMSESAPAPTTVPPVSAPVPDPLISLAANPAAAGGVSPEAVAAVMSSATTSEVAQITPASSVNDNSNTNINIASGNIETTSTAVVTDAAVAKPATHVPSSSPEVGSTTDPTTPTALMEDDTTTMPDTSTAGENNNNMTSDSQSQPATLTRTCVALNVQQKHLVYDEYLRRKRDKESLDQQGLATWALKKFNLTSPPSQSTISRILKTVGSSSAKHNILRGVNKRNRLTGNPQLEQALHAWINAQFAARRNVNGSVIVEAAKRIQDKMNNALPVEKRVNMKFSNGWLQKFKQRCTLSSFKLTGDSGQNDPVNGGMVDVTMQQDTVNNIGVSADGIVGVGLKPHPNEGVAIVVANATMASIEKLIESVDRKDLWCANEFGHCYKMAPESAALPSDGNGGVATLQRTSDLKPNFKNRITYLVCVNANGSERMPLLVVGRSPRPRVFEGKTREELDFDYFSSQDALMTSTIFFEWLMRFESHIASTHPTRKVVLLLENCTVHGTVETLPQMDHVRVFFLPNERIPKRFPLHGIIYALKARYRRRQYLMALDNVDAGRQNIYNVDLFTAIRIMMDIWDKLSFEMIGKCWKESGILDAGVSPRVAPDVILNGTSVPITAMTTATTAASLVATGATLPTDMTPGAATLVTHSDGVVNGGIGPGGEVSKVEVLSAGMEMENGENALIEINRLAVSLVPPVTLSRICVEDVVFPKAEEEFMQSTSEEKLAESAAAALIAKDQVMDDEGDDSCLMDTDVGEKLRALVVVKHMLLKQNICIDTGIENLENMQVDLRQARDKAISGAPNPSPNEKVKVKTASIAVVPLPIPDTSLVSVPMTTAPSVVPIGGNDNIAVPLLVVTPVQDANQTLPVNQGGKTHTQETVACNTSLGAGDTAAAAAATAAAIAAVGRN